ncbi:MAG TPA: DUF4276 family protein [Thermoguttaceae bacterium]|nr:DUF4276 family protein [Thermoguttaceae bacterium]
MILNLGCIVEGHGEVAAVPVLLRRLQQEYDPSLSLNIPRPFRAGRYKLVKPGELERTLEKTARRLAPPCAILVLIDAEDDCPKELAPELLKRVQRARPDIPSGVVLAKHEFEAWFLAAIESLSGRRGLSDNPRPVPDPEAVGDAKKLLTRNMPGSRAYSETLDQPALAALFDLQLARQRSDSFDKCCREVERLFREALR